VTDLALSPDGTLLAAAWVSSDNAIRLYDLATGKELRRLRGHTSRVTTLTFSGDGKTLASASYPDQTIRTWEVPGGRERLAIRTGRSAYRTPVALSPDGNVVAAPNAADGTVRLWDASTGKELRRIETAAKTVVTGVVFSPDGSLLATTEAGRGSISLWDAATGKLLRRVETPSPSTYRVAFSADGRSLIACGRGAALLEVATGEERLSLGGHNGDTCAVALSGDGSLAFTGGADTTVLVWDVTGRRTARPAKLTAAELDRLWADLSEAEGRRAFRAVARLVCAPNQAVPLLVGRLPPARAPDPGERRRIARLVAGLDADELATRENATRELEALGRAAEPQLRRALEGGPSAEVRRRLGPLLRKLDGLTADELQTIRAVETLERIASAQAREALRKMAGGAPDARLTREARASLGRLGRRR
jgi:sugar lactone lactonase YvrE